MFNFTIISDMLAQSEIPLEYLVGGVAFALGLAIALAYSRVKRKKWYIETMNPREEFFLGRESQRIIGLKIVNRTFHGVKAGKFTILLKYGGISEYAKPIFKGKIENMYAVRLAESLLEKKLLSSSERTEIVAALRKRLPLLRIEGFMITGELVSPEEILDRWEDADDRDRAFYEMKNRKLIKPNVLWVAPYPPEGRLKEIMSGTLTLPAIIEEHHKDFEDVTSQFRDTVIATNRDLASFLTRIIPLTRLIVRSISDPLYAFGVILADRVEMVSGIGLQQLAERGTVEGFITAKKMIDAKLESLGLGHLTAREMERIDEIYRLGQEMKTRLDTLEEKEKAATTTPAPAPAG